MDINIEDRVAIVETAERMAKEAHRDQKYGDNDYDYFLYHVLGVVEKVVQFFPDELQALKDDDKEDNFEHLSEEAFNACIVALLHDVIEDSEFIIEDLADHGFDETIIEAVDAITKRADESYHSYIQRVRLNPIATLVKMADSTFNLEESRKEGNQKRIDKYTKNIKVLVA